MSRRPPPPTPAPAAAPEAVPSPIEGLLLRCECRVRAMVARYRVAPEDTEELLQQAFIVLVYRWEELGDPEAWLFATLRSHCRRYRRKRDRGAGEARDAGEAGPLPRRAP